ncbi:MAG TPA: hypothetical protein VFX73_05280 [Chitinophagaceae bacterium]|nr:hypothetical protein [Chitinophagaceae bacterium]
MKKILFIVVLSGMIACSPSTQIVKSWRDPGSTVSAAGSQKVLVIGMVKDEGSRRIVEDALVGKLNGKGVASYSIITEEMIKAAKEDALNEKLAQGGFTHILMVRLADIEKETSYVPGTTTAYYGGYGRYYGYGASMYGSPGYYTEDKNYFVETAIYSVTPDKLLWTGTTKTVNPTKMQQTINDVSTAVLDQMKKDGFLLK